MFQINDSRLRAVASKDCEAEPNLGDANAAVDFVNQRPEPVFVSFTLSDHGRGPIQRGANCTPAGAVVRIAPGETCAAAVAPSTSSRFCAALDHVPADCFDAQTHH
jgi:S-methylmethionine-dependent homocysteine/selenocysteine methylase